MIEAEFKLRCDRCRSWLTYMGVNVFDPAIWSYAQVRQFAKNVGWKRSESRDLCDACVQRGKLEKKARLA
jgi:hypothetical protein